MRHSRKIKITLFALIIFLFFTINTNLFSESIFFSTRTTFANSQFWERQVIKDTNDVRKVFSNFFTGSIGLGMEMIIWDMGKKRGSRLYFKFGTDLHFSGLSYVGAYDENSTNFIISPLNINGGAFYTGVGWDIFFGGTIPKTDIIWGFGSIFNFLFPSYSPNYNVGHFFEKFAFYAVPSVLIGYDIFIPKSDLKITPQIRTGFTCNSFIPDDLIRDVSTIDGDYKINTMYSGVYIDISVAFSFINIPWKE